MKCKNCGATFPTIRMTCPFCGTENALGKLWVHERTEAEQKFEEERRKAQKKTSPYVYNRVITRILVVEGVIALVLAVIFVLGSAYGYDAVRTAKNKDLKHNEAKLTEEAASYFDSGNYEALQRLISENEIYSDTNIYGYPETYDRELDPDGEKRDQWEQYLETADLWEVNDRLRSDIMQALEWIPEKGESAKDTELLDTYLYSAVFSCYFQLNWEEYYRQDRLPEDFIAGQAKYVDLANSFLKNYLHMPDDLYKEGQAAIEKVDFVGWKQRLITELSRINGWEVAPEFREGGDAS